MPISYSETSSEGQEMDLGWAYADANYGIPEKCFCSRQMKLESSKGEETGTPGRKYYSCPDWFKEASGEHIWKWWDEGVTEQISIVQREFEEQREKLLRLDRLQAFDPTIGEIKEEVRLLQGERSRTSQIDMTYSTDIPTNFGNMIGIRNEVRDRKIQQQLKADLVEHIWHKFDTTQDFN